MIDTSSRSRFALFVFSIVGALGVTLLLILLIMRPPLSDMLSLALFLSATGAASAAVGYFSQRLGWWERIPSLQAALVVGYVLAAALILLNVWITAQLMFVNPHDLNLALLLLLFASGIAVAFGMFLSGPIASLLSDVSTGAARVSRGDFSVRVEPRGPDDIAQLAESFNKMAARLEAAAAEKEALEAARRNLVAWASHDLRTPLTSLRAMTDALADGIVADADTTQRYLQQSKAEIERMSRLIDDLFELAQLDAGGLVLHCEPASLSDLISDTLAAFSARARAAEVALQGEVAQGVDPVPMAADKIGRVLNNLVENALRHTPAGGAVRVRAYPEGETVAVEVTDTGLGIEAEHLPHVFDHFYRGESSRTRGGYDSGGAGLGLAIVRGLVEAHGGETAVESVPDSGTTLRFTLPR